MAVNKDSDPSRPEEYWSDEDAAALSAYLKKSESFTAPIVQPSYFDTLRPHHSAFSYALNDIMVLLKRNQCEAPILIDAYTSFQHLTRLPVTRDAIIELLEFARADITEEEYIASYAILLTAEITQIFALENGQNADAKRAVLRDGLTSWLLAHRTDEGSTLYNCLLEFVNEL